MKFHVGTSTVTYYHLLNFMMDIMRGDLKNSPVEFGQNLGREKIYIKTNYLL